MWHSPLAEWKHALAKQCGLDLVFPCIIVKMFVSAIVSLLLLGTAALPWLLIAESRVSPFPYQFTSREIKAEPSSRRFMSTHCSVPGFLLPRRKQKVQCSKKSSKISIAKRNVVWLPPLAVLLAPDQGLTWGRNPPLRCSSGSPAPLDLTYFEREIRAGSLLPTKRMLTTSPEFLRQKDGTFSVLASAPSLTEGSFHIQPCASDGVLLGWPGVSALRARAALAQPSWAFVRKAHKT